MKRSFVVEAVNMPLKHQTLPAGLAITPDASTGSAALEVMPGLAGGVWEHSAGVSTDIEQDEVFVVVAGRGRIRLDDGSVLELQPGTVGVLRAGEHTRWEIDEPLRKVWFATA